MIELKTKAFWRATIALGIASFFIFANIYFPQPLLPVFTDEFDVSPVVSSLSISLALFTLGVCFFIYSALSDAIGRKKIMMVTMGLGTITTFAIAFSPNYETLIVLRVLQAAFLAGIPTIAMAYIGEEFSVRALTLAIGIHISANTVGGMSGRLVSGFVNDLVDWRFAFIVMGVISLVCLIVFAFLLPTSRQFQAQPFHLKGAINGYKEHLKNPTLLYAYAIGGLHFFIFVGLFNFVTYLLSDEPFYLSTTILGLIFLTYIAGTISSTLAGKVSARIKSSTCVAIGIVIMVVAMMLTLVESVLVIFVGLLLLCFGFFFAHSVASSWVSRRAEFAKASASGLYLTSYYFGGSLGSVYLGFFWNGWHWPGVVVGALLVLVVTTSCMLGMKRIEKAENKEALSA
ncbi:MFS transporter [Texcoconibacillus texcoconensis]|uniref:YNFM family putative membrane transporter n=1 Tax=Texcoconibacillus texcoconensis TaxID=1095777 RepID=A0A840QLQ9_9BACI|nr:MFS transporter [Texcoconibacillus texcoconensis]MBB5172309.1 YNFM family putative membrane transporter [Texcoconibacillus texcoconensis]